VTTITVAFATDIYEIDFSSNIKARKFLNVNRLMKIWDNVMPGQVLISPNPVRTNGKLEQIMDKFCPFGCIIKNYNIK
jgi:hypothetical protein